MSDFGLHELRDSALSYNPEFADADKMDADSNHGDAASGEGGPGDGDKLNEADPERGFSHDSETFKGPFTNDADINFWNPPPPHLVSIWELLLIYFVDCTHLSCI